jgi:hypothetical protein
VVCTNRQQLVVIAALRSPAVRAAAVLAGVITIWFDDLAI